MNQSLPLDFHGTAENKKQVKILDKVDVWRDELETRLNGFIKVFNAFECAESELTQYIKHNASSISLVNAIPKVINTWIESKCKEASGNAENGSHLVITSDRLPSDVSRFDFPRANGFFERDPEVRKGLSIWDATGEELVAFVLKTFDFDALSKALEIQAGTIETQGFKEAATCFNTEFYLRHNIHNEGPLQVKSQKGRYLLETSYYGCYQHDRIRSIAKLIPPARTLENETGVHGLARCLQAIVQEEESLSSHLDGRVDSRTKVNVGQEVEAVFFKDKIIFHFEPEFFEAFIAFIREYSDEPIRMIEV